MGMLFLKCDHHKFKICFYLKLLCKTQEASKYFLKIRVSYRKLYMQHMHTHLHCIMLSPQKKLSLPDS